MKQSVLIKMRPYVNKLYRNFTKVEGAEYLLLEDLTKLQADIIAKLAYLLMETEFTTRETKVYLQYQHLGSRQAAELIQVNPNTFRVKIRYDNEKILKHLGDPLETITNPKTTLDEIQQLQYKLNQLIEKCKPMGKDLSEFTMVPIPYRFYQGDLTDEEFNKALEVLYKLSKKYGEILLKSLSDKQMAYLHYLCRGNLITKRDQERKEKMMAILK